ncbi:MAG TPA: hypothetical protein VGE01_03835 [Fimbriimonas sp.]
MSGAASILLLASVLAQGGTPVLPPDEHLRATVSGLERTDAARKVVPVAGKAFARALQVTVRRHNAETNATQLSMPVSTPVRQGDVLLATFWLRGSAAAGKTPARVEFLFERTENPWTKSVTHPASSARDPKVWRKVLVPFRSAETYKAREAMVSLRFAFQPQTVEIGGLSVVNYGRSRSLDSLVDYAIAQNPVGRTQVSVNLNATKQTMMGFGGNFCQPRYGATEPMDAVGRYVLGHLDVVHARIGLPLNNWNPEPGVFKDDAQARASLLALKQMAERKIPTVASIWEGPIWMLGGQREQSGRTLPPDRYDECIDAVARYLVLARDKYGANVQYFSFNEPDYGVNFKFTPKQMADFVRQAGPEFARRGLKTKFLVGDTANGSNFYDYAEPLLEDKSIAPYLGPLAFHSWDALGASDLAYTRIAELGRKHGKPVWCLEAGHDAALWQSPNPWESWDNALRTALAYERTLRLTGASLMDYWTYQDNYPLVNKAGNRPFPVFHVMRQMERVFPRGSKIAVARSAHDELQAIASKRVGGRFAVLLINPVGAGRATLTGLPPGAKVTVATSDRTAQNRNSAAVVNRAGRLDVVVPTRSVVSVVR